MLIFQLSYRWKMNRWINKQINKQMNDSINNIVCYLIVSELNLLICLICLFAYFLICMFWLVASDRLKFKLVLRLISLLLFLWNKGCRVIQPGILLWCCKLCGMTRVILAQFFVVMRATCGFCPVECGEPCVSCMPGSILWWLSVT